MIRRTGRFKPQCRMNPTHQAPDMKGVAVVTANELRQRLQIKNKLKCRQADETSLAEEMNIPMAEVYEVAMFYHHFEMRKDGEPAPA